MTGGIDHLKSKSELITCMGCCCVYGLLYYEFPACIGIESAHECLCVSHECCLAQGHAPLPVGLQTGSGDICKLSLYFCSIALKMPTLCCKGAGHCCCTVGEGALPPDAGIPQICAVYGIMCHPKFGLCVPFSEVKK